jgi:hypothetical protein
MHARQSHDAGPVSAHDVASATEDSREAAAGGGGRGDMEQGKERTPMAAREGDDGERSSAQRAEALPEAPSSPVPGTVDPALPIHPRLVPEPKTPADDIEVDESQDDEIEDSNAFRDRLKRSIETQVNVEARKKQKMWTDEGVTVEEAVETLIEYADAYEQATAVKEHMNEQMRNFSDTLRAHIKESYSTSVLPYDEPPFTPPDISEMFEVPAHHSECARSRHTNNIKNNGGFTLEGTNRS